MKTSAMLTTRTYGTQAVTLPRDVKFLKVDLDDNDSQTVYAVTAFDSETPFVPCLIQCFGLGLYLPEGFEPVGAVVKYGYSYVLAIQWR